MGRFRNLSGARKLMVVLTSLLMGGLGFAVTLFLLLLSLFGRSIHGAPPSLLVYAIPFAGALVAAVLTFALMCRILGGSHR